MKDLWKEAKLLFKNNRSINNYNLIFSFDIFLFD
jgi:hypothetical protein